MTDKRLAIDAIGCAVGDDLAEPGTQDRAIGPDHVLDATAAVAAHASASATTVDVDEPARC